MNILKKLFFVIIALFPIISSAQAIQKGLVVEQNSGGKTIDNVQIKVFGAIPTISDINGEFSLSFSIYKAGERIICEEISKQGYEIVNQLDIDKWILSETEVFVIVLCKKGELAEARDRYYQVGKLTANQNLKELETQYNKLLQEHQITEQEYKVKMEEFQEEQKRTLEQLAYYSDKFARINKDNINELGLNALKLFEAGDIKGAVALYEEENAVGKLKEKKSVRDEANEDIQNLIKVLKEENDYRAIAGGYKNYQIIESNWLEIATADTADFQNVVGFADYLGTVGQYSKSIKWYMTAQRHTTDIIEKILIYNNLGTIYLEMRDFEKCDDCLQKSLTLSDMITDKNSNTYKNLYSNILSELGKLNMETYNLEESKKYFSKALEIKSEMAKTQNEKYLSSYANTLQDFAYLYYKVDQRDKAIEYFTLSKDIYENLIHYDSMKYFNNLSLVYTNLGAVYYENKNITQAIDYHLKSYEICKKAANDSLNISLANIALAASNIGSAYRGNEQFTEAEKYLLEASGLYEYLSKNNYATYSFFLYYTYNNIGGLYYILNNYDKGELYLKKALDIAETLSQQNETAHCHILATANNQLGSFYENYTEYDKAEKYYLEAQIAYNQWIKINYAEAAGEYANFLDNFSGLYLSMGRADDAEKIIFKALKIRKELAKENFDANGIYYASSLNNIGFYYGGNGNFKKAAKYIAESTKVFEKLTENQPDQYNYYLVKNYNNQAFVNWKSGNYKKAEELYLKSIKMIKDIQFEYQGDATTLDFDLAQFTKNLAIMYFDMKRYDEAKILFNESLPLYKKLQDSNPGKANPEIEKIEGYLKKML